MTVWWSDFLWGLWNGATAWIALLIHVFGGDFPIYNSARDGSWYAFGFLLGVVFIASGLRSRRPQARGRGGSWARGG